MQPGPQDGPPVDAGLISRSALLLEPGSAAALQAGRGFAAELLAQIDALLAEAGSAKSRILSATIYLADISTFAEMNGVWDAWVDKANPPARATVEAKLVTPDYRVEIAVIAAR